MEKNERKEKRQRIEWSLVLPVGEENAISAEELTRRLGFNDKRETRRAVSEARLSGIPVCSLQKSEKYGGGYFMADASKLDQVEHVANELKKRAFTSLMQVKQLNQWIREHNGKELFYSQMSISDFMEEAGSL